MAVFTSFSDESGSGDPQGVFLVGGYVAPEYIWSPFAAAWHERVLQAPPPIPYLHMSEIKGEKFKRRYHLSDLDVQDKIEEAVTVIRSTGLLGVVSPIQRRDLRDIIHRRLREHSRRKRLPVGLDEPDYLCFIAYVWVALNFVRDEYGEAVQKVDFVVARKGKVTTRIGRFRDDMERCLRPELAALLGELIPGDPKDRNPLQAADLYSWHLRRYHETGTTDANYQKLLETAGGCGNWTRAGLAQFIDSALPPAESSSSSAHRWALS
jgi:hypothetical protein